jgi:pSer/pThr/pTyr-binding forkhead associated (FHA) protein
MPKRWEVVVTIDPSLYADPDPTLPCPTDETPRVFQLDLPDNLIGRTSISRDIHPEIPRTDSGVSHRHAKLLRQVDGNFVVRDVGSTNGTSLNGKPVEPGVDEPLNDGDQITLGCWTRIAVRAASGS